MTIYAVIDTNVLVSTMVTHNKNASTVRVLRAILEEKIIPLFNDEILAEYDEVLHRPKFNLRETDIRKMLSNIITHGEKAERVFSQEEIIDPKDVVFYEVALSKDGAYLVTGNLKHFPKKPIVVTPAEMIQILEENGLIEKQEYS